MRLLRGQKKDKKKGAKGLAPDKILWIKRKEGFG
jgi:hypothetical protein